MNKQLAIDVIRGSNLSERADSLIEHLLPSARIAVRQDIVEAFPDPLVSYLGGLPSLPHDAQWPMWDSRDHINDRITRLESMFQSNPRAIGLAKSAARLRENMPTAPTPLAFLGQLNLKELAASTQIQGWPEEGNLAFFYGWVSGFDPLERGGSRVLFFPDHKALIPMEPPPDLPQSQRYPRRNISFRPEWTLPSPWGVWPRKEDRVMRHQLDALRRQLASVSNDKEPVHRIAGHPDQIQGDMHEMPACHERHLVRRLKRLPGCTREKAGGRSRRLASVATDRFG